MKEKQSIADLAILGGRPAFAQSQHVGAPNIGKQERFFERLQEMFRRGRLANHGPFVRELERAIAREVDAKHCIAMCNGTVALEIAIRALELQGEVILPSMTFVATAHALQWQQIRPVFCDVDPQTCTLDPERVEELITPNTSGIIGVHLWGRACDADALAMLAARYNLRLMFDAAHAFQCSHKGRMIGSFGDAEVFSFHATKFFNTFEGGAVVTNNDALARKIRFMQNFGFAGKDQVDYVGINGKMNEVCAAMGLTSLESIEQFIEVNRTNYHCYAAELTNLAGIKLLAAPAGERSNYQYIVLEVDEQHSGISRDLLVQVLEAENVLARRYFYPGCHRMEPYRSYYPQAGLLLPVTNRLVEQTLCLPTGMAIGEEAIRRICRIIRLALAHAETLRYQLENLNTAAAAPALAVH